MTVGKEGISAKIIADSIGMISCPGSKRITTFELEYPRFILAELNTHRMLSKNSSSSRAIPVQKMLDMITENPAMPVWWGKNQPGMSAKEELSEELISCTKNQWDAARMDAAKSVKILNTMGLHKQIANRITEPWQRMKTVVTGTEWANLLWLRDHADAQPEFAELAKCIREEFENSKPKSLAPGEWHLPYVLSELAEDGSELAYFSEEGRITPEQALKLSSSCCAQVSYRNMNDSLEKAIEIYDKLVGSSHKHASPFEHQATPMKHQFPFQAWQDGITHKDRDGDYWSGNFRGWIQHRQLIPGHVHW